MIIQFKCILLGLLRSKTMSCTLLKIVLVYAHSLHINPCVLMCNLLITQSAVHNVTMQLCNICAIIVVPTLHQNFSLAKVNPSPSQTSSDPGLCYPVPFEAVQTAKLHVQTSRWISFCLRPANR